MPSSDGPCWGGSGGQGAAGVAGGGGAGGIAVGILHGINVPAQTDVTFDAGSAGAGGPGGAPGNNDGVIGVAVFKMSGA